MASIRINAFPLDNTPSQNDYTAVDGGTTRRTTVKTLVETGRPAASQAEAETGTEPTKVMTPLTTAQAITARTPPIVSAAIAGLGSAAHSNVGDFATAAQGAKADSALQRSANLSELTDKAAARVNLGGGTTGISVFQAANSSTALTSLGATAVGSTLFTAASAAAAQAAIGATAVGSALLTAANAAGARSAIGAAIGSNVQAYNPRLDDLANTVWQTGDLILFNGSNFQRLQPGTSGQFLRTGGPSGYPAWVAIPGGGDMIAANNLSDLPNKPVAVSNLGATATGKALFTAADAPAAQTAIGATAVGKALLTAADAPAAQTAIGATATGKALITAADKAGGRSAIDAFAIPLGTTSQYLRGDGSAATLDKTAVGLGNVDNTSDANKPVSTATQTALSNKLDLAGGTMGANGAITWPTNDGTNAALFLGASNNETGPGIGYSRGVVFGNPSGFRARAFLEIQNGSWYGLTVAVENGVGQPQRYSNFRSDGGFYSAGSVNGTAKNFLIDHPADPANYDLRHCSTESPEMLVEYRGTAKLVKGRATVDVEQFFKVMPGAFTGLWADARVEALQNQTGFARVRPTPVNGAVFEIISEDNTCADTISWLLMARRNDPYVRWKECNFTDDEGRLIVEIEKDDA